MSQEDATKYDVNQQHYHYNHYQGSNSRQQLTMKYENKRSVAAEPNATLYENFIATGDKNNKNQNGAVDAKENKSTTVNYEYRLVPNGTTVVNTDDVAHTAADYENLNFNRHLQLDKKILLQKYFRTALVGPRNNIYENLCRGCNYGVFTARGPLCSFCECIVNGVTSISASPAESSNNIYENICAHCAQFYSGNDEDDCQCRKKTKELHQVTFRETETEKDIKPSGSAANLNKVDSEELLVKDLDEKKNVKIRKSKSFNKTTKPKILTNLWDTLRKHKAPATAALVARKPLEIVHNVEGFEQVFHTKETFDLKKICELKRSATSCSDQHIYGRLKPRDLDRSQEDFLSTQSLIQTEQKVKRSRVSKPKFLRSLSAEPKTLVKSQLELNNAQNPQYYLNPSVCLWMTSLRREVLNTYHVVNTCILSLSDEDNDCLLCYPKSIPPKNLLNLSCNKAPQPRPSLSNGGVSNRLNIYETAQNHGRNVTDHFTYYDTDTESESWDSAEIVALRRHNGQTSISSYDSVEGQGEIRRQQQQQQQVGEFLPSRDHYQQMVDEFKFHLQNKQMKQQQQQQQQLQQKYDRMVNHSTMNATGGGGGADARIPLRQAISSNHNKAKRQGMYLRLGEQHIVQNPEYERVAINNNSATTHTNDSNNNDTHKQLLTYGNVNNSDVINTVIPTHLVDLSDALLVAALEESTNVSQSLTSQTIASPDTDKRLAIHERDILQAFEALLRLQKDQHQPLLALTSHTDEESQGKQRMIAVSQQQSLLPYGADVQECKQYPFTSHSWPVIIVEDLSKHLQLSLSLNTAVISYDKYLCLFLRYIVFSSRHAEKYKHKTQKQLLRTFQRFHSHCCERFTLHSSTRSSLKNSIKSKLDLMKTNACYANANAYSYTNRGLITIEQRQEIPNTINESFVHDDDDGIQTNVLIVTEPYPAVEQTTNVLVTTRTPSENHNRKPKKPPEVPKRDPTTKLSPTTEHLPPVPLHRTIIPLNEASKMTVPSSNLAKDTKHEKSQEENIYQPIWKFKTVGEVQERFKTDADYYDIKELQQEKPCDSCALPEILISEEDHSEWEPDEEFVFSSKPQKTDCDSITDKNSTIRSNRSNVSSIGTTSLSGSTITDFASSTATLASCVSTSLMHHLFRNIGIFYSLTEPKLRAIIYDYDRIHSSRYFGKTSSIAAAPTTTATTSDDSNINDSGLGKSPTPTFANRSPVPAIKSKETLQPFKCSSSESVKLSEAKAGAVTVTSDRDSVSSIKANPPPVYQIPKSVEAWKYQLLNVNYMEDEEDMIVSENEILRAQKIKEDVQPQPQAQPQIFIQRFKSRSTDNILDLPLEDDKRSFGDRVRDKLQRGILNINNKSSPKSEKRLYKAIRNSQTTSLYLEDGINPKYPIFAAPLMQLELNQTTYPNVPRFVVDSVEYIERKDRIVQDGLYRACGNKFSIDELKQKLSKSYIYDPKLIAADDIHTIASLLKQFFRDLPHPLIPQETYNCLARDLTLNEGIDALRIAINQMPEPNKSTLAFLIKHLTNVAACSSSNRMNASNLAIVWGPSLFTLNEAKTYDIGRMNTLAKVLIENYNRIFHTNERLL